MPTPFAGMDPYLEHPGLWEDVHTRLIVAIADVLGPQVRPRYRVAMERRTYLAVLMPDEYELVGKPDVLIASSSEAALPAAVTATSTIGAPYVGELPMPDEVVERYLEVRDVATGEVITAIEILSPINKLTREGRSQYERKRLKVLGSDTHLVEIDLLRSGEPLPVRIPDLGRRAPYQIIVSRAQQRPRTDVYLFGLRDSIPDIPVPLRSGEPEPVVPLNQVLHELYERAGYDQAIDYRKPLAPPLPKGDAAWAARLLAPRD
jgi:Protein of unknown function (DUF4058)